MEGYSVSKQTFDLAVIGTPGEYRNHHLEKALGDWDYLQIHPKFLSRQESLELADVFEASSLLLGRKLLEGELGCLLAHNEARSKSRMDWILVLEDDADIEKLDLKVLEEISARLDPRMPTVISLCSGSTRLGSSPKLKRIWHLPPLNLAYMASYSVESLDSDREGMIGVADWPLGFVGARFFTVDGFSVSAVDSRSTIDPENLRQSSASNYYVPALRNVFRIHRRFGLVGVYYALVSPLLRDLSKRVNFLKRARRYN